jgi:hypothetical protein
MDIGTELTNTASLGVEFGLLVEKERLGLEMVPDEYPGGRRGEGMESTNGRHSLSLCLHIHSR